MSTEVDTELEQRLEAVLVRHGIPAELGNSDRGDLSSDLADAARKFTAERKAFWRMLRCEPPSEGSE